MLDRSSNVTENTGRVLDDPAMLQKTKELKLQAKNNHVFLRHQSWNVAENKWPALDDPAMLQKINGIQSNAMSSRINGFG